jgi:hypothetical protein
MTRYIFYAALMLIENLNCRLQLKTDREKCNAWIKMAVNGNLLGSYITTIDQDHSLLKYANY